MLHSCTKYIGGHCDILGGALIYNDSELHKKLHLAYYSIGSNMSPFSAYLVLRSLKTLGLRMERHCYNARVIFEYLADHPKVGDIFYPGRKDLDSYPIVLK